MNLACAVQAGHLLVQDACKHHDAERFEARLPMRKRLSRRAMLRRSFGLNGLDDVNHWQILMRF